MDEEAALITSVRSSMLAGFMSTMLKLWSVTSMFQRLIRRSSAEMKVSWSLFDGDRVDVIGVGVRVEATVGGCQDELPAVDGAGETQGPVELPVCLSREAEGLACHRRPGAAAKGQKGVGVG